MATIPEGAQPLPVGLFWGQEGLKVPHQAVLDGRGPSGTCEGVIQVRRHPETLLLQNSAYCVGCGQEFFFGTDLEGLQLEQALRGPPDMQKKGSHLKLVRE